MKAWSAKSRRGDLPMGGLLIFMFKSQILYFFNCYYYYFFFLHLNSVLGQEYPSTFRSVTDLKFLVFTGSFSVIISPFSCAMGPEILQIMNCRYDITHVKLSTTQMGWLWNKNTLLILYKLQWLCRKHVSNCSCRWAPLVRCLTICRHTASQILSHRCLGLQDWHLNWTGISNKCFTYYTPCKQSWWGYTCFTLSVVHLPVDEIVSALYLPQY